MTLENGLGNGKTIRAENTFLKDINAMKYRKKCQKYLLTFTHDAVRSQKGIDGATAAAAAAVNQLLCHDSTA